MLKTPFHLSADAQEEERLVSRNKLVDLENVFLEQFWMSQNKTGIRSLFLPPAGITGF